MNKMAQTSRAAEGVFMMIKHGMIKHEMIKYEMIEHELLITELEKVIQYYKSPAADFCWQSEYYCAQEAILEMTNIMAAMKKGDMSVLERLSFLFLPIGCIQAIAISSGWGRAYLEIANKVDWAINKLRRKHSFMRMRT
jgi:hypothetical protein